MSLKEYYKNMDESKALKEQHELDEASKFTEERQTLAIAKLRESVEAYLPNLSPHLGKLVYNFDHNGGGAFVEFEAEGKKFLLYTQMVAGALGSGNRMVLAVRESGKLRELGGVPFPRHNAIFKQEAAEEFERDISNLLRKEIGL